MTPTQTHAAQVLTDAETDQHLDAVLNGAGSALRHYTTEFSLSRMRAAMREHEAAILAKLQPAQAGELPEPELGYIKTDKSNQPAYSARQMRAALASRPAGDLPTDEPNMRHQKVQAILSAKARLGCELGLIETILDAEDVDDVSTGLIEYWGPLHDRIIALRRAALAARKPLTDAWQDVPACPDGDVWFSLSCGHVVMGYKHGAIFDWEANIDHDCCGDATATKAMPVTPPDSYGIGLEVKT